MVSTLEILKGLYLIFWYYDSKHGVVMWLRINDSLRFYISEVMDTFALTHWGRGKIAAILQMTVWNAFSWMKMYEFRFRFHWNLFELKVQINNILVLVQMMAWRRPGDKPLSEPMMVSSLTHIYVTRTQWVKLVATPNWMKRSVHYGPNMVIDYTFFVATC